MSVDTTFAAICSVDNKKLLPVKRVTPSWTSSIGENRQDMERMLYYMVKV
ncbi:hypothetical protein DAPPUDRAFT_246636 [Daphnia pulex]|uniref:Uncharacterized protein n=1 Tax=Daphnia pulex TaxID=6669 RepID=E9GQ54_DAPPU|nr:hypothetical protein DAPPUDRAFT_246636 [Daphnia pulex]|eukprot:EFX78227.1 hypothetical protein DAPPUDRAFT_246636 [Daphnia pulex]